MEESTERRERLKVMRMEASQEDATYNNDHSAVSLSNPLLESTTNSETKAQTTSQSFNYYTNPLAAYYGNKHRSQVSPQLSQNFSSTHPRLQTNETFPSPFLQPHINHSPNAQMQQPQGSYASSNHAYSSNPPQSSSLTNPSWRSNSPHPRGYSAPQGVGFPSPQTHFTSGSGQGSYPSLGSSLYFTNSPGPNFKNSSHFANSPGHGPGRGYLSPGPNFRNSPNHGSGQGGYPSSGPSSGRGRGGGPG
ncbi:protein SICKLE-like [Helianthus annuus]|uniref:protein SICKLE-like n=1 Tax=Helianthus annuus TaxID=4232 RepID=UPI0016531944|nr:protein SICKLE-like [Helianthus annuus]